MSCLYRRPLIAIKRHDYLLLEMNKGKTDMRAGEKEIKFKVEIFF